MYQIYVFYSEYNVLTLRDKTVMLKNIEAYIKEHTYAFESSFIFAKHDAERVAVLINYVCDHFTPHSSLYNSFLMAFCCSEKTSLSTGDRLMQYPKSFLADVML